MKKFYLGLFFAYAGQLGFAQPAVEVVDRQIQSVTESIPESIPESVETQVDELEQARVDNVTAELVKDLPTAGVTELPQRLAIVTSVGRTLLVESEVENGWRAVEREWLAQLDPTELPELQQSGVTIVEQTHFKDLGVLLVRFRVPSELDSLAALKKHLPRLRDRLDRNHIYAAEVEPVKALPPIRPSSAAAAKLEPICKDAIKIGVIDTAVEVSHPAFIESHIVARNFIDPDVTLPMAHGTAVAGLLVAQGPELQPLVPQARLYSASVFYSRNQYEQGATMINLVHALNWLAGENVPVINMSLAGPPNHILARVIMNLVARGRVIVAAAGNEGPAAAPLYPAAYPGVIAVTAVDAKNHIYRWANQGDHIYFAAVGVSVNTVRGADAYGRESGTSMAAPVISAFIACELHRQPDGVVNVLRHLRTKAIDLGEQGRDPIFGYGLLEHN